VIEWRARNFAPGEVAEVEIEPAPLRDGTQ
jgi:hypothetical protein